MPNDNLALFTAQCDDIQKMRDQLLSFNKTDPQAARKAIQNVTLLRVYHQIERIVRFLDMIDKLEDRIYQSIEAKLANSDPDDDTLFLTLIPIQERLQKTMVDSHKLLEPYLSMEQLSALEVPQSDDPTKSFTNMLLEQESREKVRTGVQELLAVINTIDVNQAKPATVVEDTDTVQSKAQEVLAELQALKSEENQNSES